jgi:uncharacterized protein YjiS (DUF1127 family)
MPPQQTNSGSETDAAVLGVDLTIELVKAAGDTLAAARPDAPIALDNALSETAAGSAGVPTRDVFSLLKRYWRAFAEWQRLSSRTALHDLSDRELKDIGVTRDEIDHIIPHRAIDALRDSIHSRGVM